MSPSSSASMMTETATASVAHTVNKAGLVRRLDRCAGRECGPQRVRARKLAGDDPHGRSYGANRTGDSAGERAAPEGNKDRFDIGRLLENLQSDRAVASNGCGIAHSVDVEALLVREHTGLYRPPPFFARAHVDAGAQAPEFLQLYLGRIFRHNCGSRDPESARHPRDGKRTVARTCGVDSVFEIDP